MSGATLESPASLDDFASRYHAHTLQLEALVNRSSKFDRPSAKVTEGVILYSTARLLFSALTFNQILTHLEPVANEQGRFRSTGVTPEDFAEEQGTGTFNAFALILIQTEQLLSKAETLFDQAETEFAAAKPAG